VSWKDKTAIRILLLVAKMVAGPAWQKEIEQLSSHTSCWLPETKEIA